MKTSIHQRFIQCYVFILVKAWDVKKVKGIS